MSDAITIGTSLHGPGGLLATPGLARRRKWGRRKAAFKEGPGDYLVVEDREKKSTWHLPVKRNGKPDHGLMGAAHAALTVGYRGNRYEGPGKQEALAKLKRLYESEGMEVPSGKSETVTTKPMTRSEAARVAALARWGKYTPKPEAARGQRPQTPAKQPARPPGRGGAARGGRGRAAAGGSAPKPAQPPGQTAEEKRSVNRDAVKQQMADNDAGLGPAGSDALMGLADGTQPNATTGDGLVEMGLMEKGTDGHYHLTPAGRATIGAMNRGDYQGAIDAINKGQTQAGAAAGRAADQQKREAERAAREEEKKKREEEKKLAPKGGGGGGAKPKQTEEEKRTAAEQAKNQTRAATAQKGGLAPESADALKQAAEQGNVTNTALAGLGLVGADGFATDAGRQALRALDRGDVAGYQAALQNARERKGRETARQEAQGRRAYGQVLRTQRRQQEQAARDYTRRQREEQRQQEREQARKKEASFIVFKDASGHHRWITHTTTAYRDRDGEILTMRGLQENADRMTATKQHGPLRWWHAGEPVLDNLAAPWGPGLDIGDCDFSMLIGRTLVESGTFRSPAVAMKMAQQADDYEVSPGFAHGYGKRGPSDGVFDAFRIFERSVVPTDYTRASNLFTRFGVKEHRMEPEEFDRRLKAMEAKLGLTPEQAGAERIALQQTDKDANARQIAYKSDDAPAPPEELTINGAVYALKAAPMVADELPVAVQEQADGEPPMIEEPMAEEPAGEYIGDMTPAEFWEQLKGYLGELLTPALRMQEMQKAMGDMLGELKGMYATKEAGAAAEITSLKEQLAANKAQQDQLAARLKELEGDQPAVVSAPDIEAALKSAGPAAPAHDPNAPQIPDDASRPLAALAAKMWPELYTTGQ